MSVQNGVYVPSFKSRLLTLRDSSLIGGIKKGELDADDFLSKGLVELLSYIGNNPDFVFDGNFHLRNDSYLSVMSYLSESGFDTRYHKYLHDALIESPSNKLRENVLNELRKSAIKKDSERNGSKLSMISMREIQGGVKLMY